MYYYLYTYRTYRIGMHLSYYIPNAYILFLSNYLWLKEYEKIIPIDIDILLYVLNKNWVSAEKSVVH